MGILHLEAPYIGKGDCDSMPLPLSYLPSRARVGRSQPSRNKIQTREELVEIWATCIDGQVACSVKARNG